MSTCKSIVSLYSSTPFLSHGHVDVSHASGGHHPSIEYILDVQQHAGGAGGGRRGAGAGRGVHFGEGAEREQKEAGLGGTLGEGVEGGGARVQRGSSTPGNSKSVPLVPNISDPFILEQGLRPNHVR